MKLRLPADLKDQIEEVARAAGRSLNAEIIHRLKLTLPPSGLSEEDTRVAGRISEALQGIIDKNPDRETIAKALRLTVGSLELLAMSAARSGDKS